jgi:microcystin-dependent protein
VADPFLSQISIVGFNFAPKGWAFCDGQLLPINQNQALFALLGTTYGGNGTTTFALPNLQGRVPLHFGKGYTEGQTGGEEAHTLIATEMPAHTHFPVGSAGIGTTPSPAGNLIAEPTGGAKLYNTQPTGTLDSGSLALVGGGQPHNNLQPYTVLSFIIALQGIFPPRN